jgi:hypothetical protein
MAMIAATLAIMMAPIPVCATTMGSNGCGKKECENNNGSFYQIILHRNRP